MKNSIIIKEVYPNQVGTYERNNNKLTNPQTKLVRDQLKKSPKKKPKYAYIANIQVEYQSSYETPPMVVPLFTSLPNNLRCNVLNLIARTIQANCHNHLIPFHQSYQQDPNSQIICLLFLHVQTRCRVTLSYNHTCTYTNTHTSTSIFLALCLSVPSCTNM